MWVGYTMLRRATAGGQRLGGVGESCYVPQMEEPTMFGLDADTLRKAADATRLRADSTPGRAERIGALLDTLADEIASDPPTHLWLEVRTGLSQAGYAAAVAELRSPSSN